MSIPSDDIKLPPLREDIQLLPGPSAHNGQPTWTLHDPASHRFLRIGWAEFEMLSRWMLGNPRLVAEAVSRETTLHIWPVDVMDLLRFAERANLLQPQGEAGIAHLLAQRQSQRMSAAMWLLKNYLFLRITLYNPDAFLGKMLVRLRWMFTSAFLRIMCFMALAGTYLIAGQWESFVHSFLYMFSMEGALIVGVVLSFAKIVHEFGHGIMTKYFGCKVPAMGVALLVLWPVLWTDTTDAWRLTARKQRLAIDAAGMLAEVILAIVASLAWSILPDGALRTAAFLLASSTWLITLTINLNPFMRFDGYFLLSDFLDMPNLQDRAFALARWWMREQLLGLGEPPPEHFPDKRKYFLLGYAYATWIYRFTLFMGIALLVYHFSFKLLGLFLMMVEIGWFIMRPIANELTLWYSRFHTGAGWNSANRRSASIAAAIFFILVVPWHTQINSPALLRAEREATLYTTVPGQLVDFIGEGTQVENNVAIATFASPDITYRNKAASAQVEGLKAHFSGQTFDPQEVKSVQKGWDELQHAEADYASVQADTQQLTIYSPFAGIVTDVPTSIHPGIWMHGHEALGILVDPSTQIVEAYVDEGDISHIHTGSHATFFFENGEHTIDLSVISIATTTINELTAPELASLYNGDIAVRKNENGKLVPTMALYKVTLLPKKPLVSLLYRQRGNVEISADHTSIMYRLYQRIAAVLVRESGL